MSDILPPAARVHSSSAAGRDLSSSAMSIEDYARVVQSRTEFVEFLLAPARGQLAAAA